MFMYLKYKNSNQKYEKNVLISMNSIQVKTELYEIYIAKITFPFPPPP